jgi:23S rRNA (uracil1939-C5)-methyltransferase
MMKRGDRIELDLTDLSYLGDGVGHVDTNLVIFAVAGLPGERVVLEIDERRHKYARGQVREIVAGASNRVAPPCPYYGACGGCQFQHLDYASQLRWKTELVRRQFRRVRNLNPPDTQPCIGSGSPWRYRNNAGFSIDSDGRIGFTRRRSHAFLPIDDCLIMQSEIAAVMPRLQGVLPGAHQIVVRYGARTGQLLIAPELHLPSLDVPSGQGSYEEVLLGRVFRVSETSFFQVNTRLDYRPIPAGIDSSWLVHGQATPEPSGAVVSPAALVELSQADLLALLVLSRLPLTGHGFVVDAYSGVGTFAKLVAERAARVVGIEEALPAVLDAEHNSRGSDNVTYLHGRTEDQLAQIIDRPDAVILDPPRVGCDSKVLAVLARLRPETIVYVSCDPATLARDVGGLVMGGYELTEIQPIDMFPQTYHIEVVCVLKTGRSPQGAAVVEPSI